MSLWDIFVRSVPLNVSVMQVVYSSTGCHSRAILGIHFTEVLNFVFVRQGCWTIRGHTNPLLPSSFDMLFAKCTAISTTKKAIDYRNLKPTRFHWFHYRNLHSTKFHRICLSRSLCPCSVPVWKSQHPKGVSITSLLLSTLPNLDPPEDCWFNMIRQILYISLLAMKRIINPRFL